MKREGGGGRECDKSYCWIVWFHSHKNDDDDDDDGSTGESNDDDEDEDDINGCHQQMTMKTVAFDLIFQLAASWHPLEYSFVGRNNASIRMCIHKFLFDARTQDFVRPTRPPNFVWHASSNICSIRASINLFDARIQKLFSIMFWMKTSIPVIDIIGYHWDGLY